MVKKIKKMTDKMKQNYQVIFTDNVSDEFEKECQADFLKYVDYLYRVLLACFAFMAVGTLYFSITRVILQESWYNFL